MAFYDLPKPDRDQLVALMNKNILRYFYDEDTYIRKTAYLAIGKIYINHKPFQSKIIELLNQLLKEPEFKVRQTTINSAGEIGKTNFAIVEHFFDQGLFDSNSAVRNAVIGSIKKMGEKNPAPVLQWAKKYLHHPEKEIRREVCHGIELRGRTHPQDILPLLKELQFDKTARVSNTLVHVLGQIAYKKNCLQTVIQDLQTWENQDLVAKALLEIIDVHDRYKNFSYLSQKQAEEYIQQNYKRA